MDSPTNSGFATSDAPDPRNRILDCLALPLFQCSRDGRVTYCNHSARVFWGHDKEGADHSILQPDVQGARPSFQELLAGVVERFPNEVGPVSLIFRQSDGSQREVISRMTYDPELDRVTCILLPGVHSLLSGLARIAQSAMQAPHVDSTLSAITSETGRMINATRCYVVYWIDDADKPSFRALTPSVPNKRLSALDVPLARSLVLKSYRLKRLISSRNIDPALDAEIVSPFGHTSSQLVAPLFAEERPEMLTKFGVLVAEGERPNQFGMDDENVLETLAVHSSIAIAHARLLVEVNSTYEEILRGMPERAFSRNLIHDAKNLVRDAAGKVEALSKEVAESTFGKKKGKELQSGLDGMNDIADILTDMLSRLKRPSQSESRRGTVDIVPLIARVRRILLHSIDIQISVDAGHHAYFVFGDASQILTIIYNLAANSVGAIRASQKSATLAISVSHTPRETALRRILISDTGPGMDTDLRRLVRSGESVSRRLGGTGIGLVSIRELVSDLGGKMDIQSSVGGGTAIIIDLPGPEVKQV
jgi:signal transduction histidine kinase